MAFRSAVSGSLSRPEAGTWTPNRVVVALRRPGVYWTLAALLTAITLWTIHDLRSDAREALDGYGPRASVLVVTETVAPAGVVDSTNVALRELPVALVPEGALEALPDPALARVGLFPGEVLMGARLAGGSGIAALVPEGSMAIAVPVGSAAPPVVVGDLVDLIATFAVAPDGSGEPSSAVARRAPVVHLTDQAVTVAITERDVADVTFALTYGVVTLAVVG